MIHYLQNSCWLILAQVQAGRGSGAATAPAADAAGNVADAAEKTPGLFDSWMFPALMAVALLYFMLMTRPKNKKGTKPAELLANLKKNDRVVTAGGILGTVVNFRKDDEYVTIRIDDSTNARMQVLASSLVRVVSDEDKEKKSE